jgi:hypothetical protein
MEKSPLLRRYVREDLGFRERVKLRLRLYRFNGKALNLLANAARPDPPSGRTGFVPLKGTLDSASAGAPAPEDYGLPPDDLNRRALRDLVALCESRNVALIVVLPPYWQGREGGAGRRALVRDLYAMGALRVYDFGDLRRTPELDRARLWKDPFHLNGDGAAVFSEMLDDSLRTMASGRARN